MSTVARQAEGVTVDVATRSVVYLVNTVLQILLRIASCRGLGPKYLGDHRDVINDGFFVWFGEGTLDKAHLEVFEPGETNASERWMFAFDYAVDAPASALQPPVAEVANLCATLDILPPGANYRVAVETACWASQVPGWEPTTLRALDRTRSDGLRAWGYGRVAAKVTHVGGPRVPWPSR